MSERIHTERSSYAGLLKSLCKAITHHATCEAYVTNPEAKRRHARSKEILRKRLAPNLDWMRLYFGTDDPTKVAEMEIPEHLFTTTD